MAFDRDRLGNLVAAAAARGVHIGTSSWKYAGWRGTLYDEARYVWRGRLSEARFERLCLAEYAEVFQTVSVDAAYYRFPDQRWLAGLVSQVPKDFLFSLKVTDEITIKRFPNLPRFQSRTGADNRNFLNSDLFISAFHTAIEPFRQNIGLLIFEFSRFSPEDFPRGREFVAVLDQFLGKLPRSWRYGVEIRNRTFLHEDYFACLRRHGVVHVYNNWTDMPPVNEQLDIPGSLTNQDIVGARFLLKPGRRYEDAVRRFSPYDRIRESYPEARAAGARLILETGGTTRRGGAFIYVNNRLEGNAIATIEAMLTAASEKWDRA